MAIPDEKPVLVVGAGPTGLTTANLLGQYGVPAVLIEAREGVARFPRASFIDDEFLRLTYTLGIGDEVRRVVIGPTQSERVSLLGFVASRDEGLITGHNFAFRSSIHQPWLDRALLDGLRRFAHVEVRFATEFVALRQTEDAVAVTLRDASGRETTREFSYVLGADGSRSAVRAALGIAFKPASEKETRTLRVDVEGDADATALTRSRPLGLKLSVQSRPSPNGRRYSANVPDGVDEETALSDAYLRRTFRPFRDFAAAKVISRTVYTFQSRAAERMRSGRCFLLGDAAHTHSPGGGAGSGAQGMNSGARDAHYLAWRLAAVLRGLASPGFLDTYEQERLEAVHRQVRLSTLGVGEGGTGRPAVVRIAGEISGKIAGWARRRQSVETALRRLPVRGPSTLRARFVFGEPLGEQAELRVARGHLLPNPWVEHEGRPRHLDQFLGSHFALVGVEVGEARSEGLFHQVWDRLPTRRLIVRGGDEAALRGQEAGIPSVRIADHRFGGALKALKGSWLVVRPDRIVFAVAKETELGAVAEAVERGLVDPSASRSGERSREAVVA